MSTRLGKLPTTFANIHRPWLIDVRICLCHSDIYSCGGCVYGSADNVTLATGQDCTSIVSRPSLNCHPVTATAAADWFFLLPAIAPRRRRLLPKRFLCRRDLRYRLRKHPRTRLCLLRQSGLQDAKVPTMNHLTTMDQPRNSPS